MEEKFHTYRSMPDERKYLKKYWSDSFTNFVRNSFKYNIELTQNNKKKSRLQKYSQSFIMLAFGVIFFFMTLQQTSLLTMLIVFALGLFFTASGLSTIYYDAKEKKQ